MQAFSYEPESKESLEEAYKHIRKLGAKGYYRDIDLMLELLKPWEMSPALILKILKVTRPMRLRQRNGFLQRAKRALRKRGDLTASEVDSLK